MITLQALRFKMISLSQNYFFWTKLIVSRDLLSLSRLKKFAFQHMGHGLSKWASRQALSATLSWPIKKVGTSEQ